MHSWVFRHRDRLRTIFGLPAPEPRAALPAEPVVALDSPEPEAPPSRASAAKQGPGIVRWTTRYAVIDPMPPRGA